VPKSQGTLSFVFLLGNPIKLINWGLLMLEDAEFFHLFLVYTDDRVGEERRRYDAFILYADEDSEFADEVITKLETEYDLRV